MLTLNNFDQETLRTPLTEKSLYSLHHASLLWAYMYALTPFLYALILCLSSKKGTLYFMARTPIKEIKNAKQRKLAGSLRDNLVSMRKELDLRQVDIADKCRLSVKYIADIEQGKSGNPTLETICELAKALGLKDPLDLLK